MKRIQAFWHNQVKAEYASAAITAEFSQWLLQVGASPDLVKQCLDIAKDEVDHAMLCYEVLIAAGDPQPANFSAESLRMMSHHNDQRKNVLDAVLNFYCLGETVAVPLFSAMKKATTQGKALEAYQRILQDEPRHSGFGWLTLAWAQEAWPETRDWIAELFPDALRRISGEYYRGLEYAPPLTAQEREWGMLSHQEYAAIFEDSVLRLYAKNLKYYGIDVESTWAKIKIAL